MSEKDIHTTPGTPHGHGRGMTDKRKETVGDVLAEMRRRFDSGDTSYLIYAYRLEAAHAREIAEANAARESQVVEIRKLIEHADKFLDSAGIPRSGNPGILTWWYRVACAANEIARLREREAANFLAAAANAQKRLALLEVAAGVAKEADMMRVLFTDGYDAVGDNSGTDRLIALAASIRAIVGEK